MDCCAPSCPCIDNMTMSIGSFVVPDIPTLRAIPTNATNRFAWVQDNLSFYGAFVWNASSTDADDGATVIQPSDLPAVGRWIKGV